MRAKKHCEAVPRGMFGIIERSVRLRSDTTIDLYRLTPHVGFAGHTGLTSSDTALP